MLTAALALAAHPAAGEARQGGKIPLRLASGSWWGAIPGKDSTDPHSRAKRAVFERFLQLHPDIEIVPASGIQLQGRAWEAGFLMSMAGGTAPDVFYVNLRKLESFVRQGFMLPLDDFVKEDPEVLRDVHPKVLDVIRVDGKIYAIPFQQFVMALYYRKDLFKEAGLDPSRGPRDWDEFYEYARRLTNPARGQYGFVFEGDPGSAAFHWVNFLWQAGAEVVKRGPDGRYRAAFATPEGVKALEFYGKLRIGPWERDGKIVKGVAARTTERSIMVERGRIGMWFAYQSDISMNMSTQNPSLIGISILPAGPAGHANEINASMWAINSQIKDPRVRRAAWEFVKFQCSEEAERLRTRTLVEAGMAKFVNPVYLKRFGYEEYLRDVPREWVEANADAFRYGRPEPHGENMEMIYVLLGEPLEMAELNPDMPALAILQRAARKIDTSLLN